MTILDRIIKTAPIGSDKASRSKTQMSSHSSKAKSLTTELRKQTSIQGRPILAEKDKNIAPTRGKQPETPARHPSSDYGDDSLDDLPSPSQLLGKNKPSFMKSQPLLKDHQTKALDGAAPDPKRDRKDSTSLPFPKAKTNIFQNRQIKSSASKEHEIIDISDTPPELTEQSIEDQQLNLTEPTTLQISMNEQPPDQKRKASQVETQSTKRFKRNSFVSPFQTQYPETPCLSEVATAPEITSPKDPSPAFETSKSPVLRTWMDMNAELLRDDTDIIEEFKNIVDYI